jgi:16S rRNA (guanine527-N7)-methyltransferase
VTPGAFQGFADVSRETLADFETYAALIAKWQTKINLISPTTLDTIWDRHFADSAQIFPLLDPGWARIVDLGTGAGFPGLVLALMAKGRGWKTRFHLVEADGRKAAFLVEAAIALGIMNLTVQIHAVRAEILAASPLAGTADAVTARALAALPDLFAHAAPLLRPDGVCLFLKGARADEEIAAAAAAGWRFEVSRHDSRLPGDGTILAISRLHSAGKSGRAGARHAIDET